MGYNHLSEWAESGCARHRAVAVAETGTVLQETLKVLRKAGEAQSLEPPFSLFITNTPSGP